MPSVLEVREDLVPEAGAPLVLEISHLPLGAAPGREVVQDPDFQEGVRQEVGPVAPAPEACRAIFGCFGAAQPYTLWVSFGDAR